MAITKITADVIDTGTITADNLNATLDLTGKTVTVANASTGDSDTTAANTAFVQQEIAALVDSSPSALNTLNELAAALGDDANFSTTVNSNIATKLPLAGGTLTGALTTNGVINTGTSHNFAINTPNSLRINIDSNDSATDQVFVIGNNQTAVDASNNVFFKISEDGYVDITSGILQLATGSNRRLFYRAGNNDVLLEAGSGLFYRQDIGNTNHSWFTGNSERMRITSGGDVGIGTTNPSSNLHVETNTHANIRIQAGTNSSASLRLRNDAVDWDVNCQTNDNFAIYNHTVGSERLVIDSSGNVTKPGHPVFDVTSSASALTGPISYNTVYVNVGSHYNTSNGRFTAPVAGTYMFTTMYIKNATSGVCRRRFILNGASSGMMNGRQLRMDSGQSYGDNGTMIIIVTLAAGDYVQVDQYVGASHGGHAYEQFSGFLIG